MCGNMHHTSESCRASRNKLAVSHVYKLLRGGMWVGEGGEWGVGEGNALRPERYMAAA